jgi:hypothetical protein
MKAKLFLSKTLINVTPSMHKIRRLSLLATVESAVNGASYSFEYKYSFGYFCVKIFVNGIPSKLGAKG